MGGLGHLHPVFGYGFSRERKGEPRRVAEGSGREPGGRLGRRVSIVGISKLIKRRMREGKGNVRTEISVDRKLKERKGKERKRKEKN